MTTAHSLLLEQVTLGYGDRTVVESLDLVLPPGRITTIVGANACGKSTLLRAMARLLKPRAGQVVLDGHDLHHLPTKEVARTLGLLPQSPVAPEGIVVADLVARGRHPHQGLWSRWSSADDAAVAEALDLTDTADLADRAVDELSGGQRQRAWISMALAQGTDLLLLDEPTTYLDLAHALEVLDLVDRLHEDRGRTVVMVLHDLNMAARYADRLVLMKDGRIVLQGSAEQVLTVELLADVFGLRAELSTDPVTGRPLVIPIGERHAKRRAAATVLP